MNKQKIWYLLLAGVVAVMTLKASAEVATPRTAFYPDKTWPDSDDYQSHSGKWIRVSDHRCHEAPAICKHAGHYWMITSGCTGRNPNTARSMVADSIWGPWKELGNPSIGINPHNKLDPEKTFGGQSTFILPVNGKPGAFIALFDIRRPKDAIAGGYVWLPITFEADRFTITWCDIWDLSMFGK